MNINRIIFYPILFIAAMFSLISCEKDANEIEYGFPVIYMPQASIFSGGLNNDYPVPGPNSISPNYVVDSVNHNVEITLGVYRAGLQVLEAFSVEVFVNADTLTSIFADSLYANSALLPADLYTFPSTVSVEAGSREAVFKLTLDQAKLNSDYAALKGKKLVVAIGIKNPTKYELNPSLSTTIVLIDSNLFFE